MATITTGSVPAPRHAAPGPRKPPAQAPTNVLSSSAMTVGNIAHFGARVIAEMPMTLGLYFSEVIRQAAILVRSSGLIIWFMMFAIGAETGLQGHYILEQVGASGYVGVFTAVGDLKADTTSMWGWILAAKVGCGYVAEIGSMRISDEIDAMETLGINSIRYLVTTRVLANILVSAPIFIIGLAVFYLGEIFVILFQVHEISKASWESVHWAFTDGTSIIFSYTKTLVMWICIVVSSLYYGYNARGGPVGVGAATARSMVVALVLTMVLNEGFTFFFWGLNPSIPVGG
jgi:phospholipid/cholesterol/gamma-HCH transport system permease protein